MTKTTSLVSRTTVLFTPSRVGWVDLVRWRPREKFAFDSNASREQWAAGEGRQNPWQCDDDDIDLFTAGDGPLKRKTVLQFFLVILWTFSPRSFCLCTISIADERPVLVKDHSMQSTPCILASCSIFPPSHCQLSSTACVYTLTRPCTVRSCWDTGRGRKFRSF